MVNFASLSLLCFCGAYHCCPNLQKNDVQLLFKSLELGKQSVFLQQACYLTPRPKILQDFWCKHSCAEPSFCSRGQKARHIMQSSALWSLCSYLLQTQSSQPSSATWSGFKVGFSAPQKCQQPAGNNSAATRWHGDATMGWCILTGPIWSRQRGRTGGYANHAGCSLWENCSRVGNEMLQEGSKNEKWSSGKRG